MQFALMISFSFNYQHFLCWHVRHAPSSCFKAVLWGHYWYPRVRAFHGGGLRVYSPILASSHIHFQFSLLLVFLSNIVNRNPGRAEGEKGRRMEVGTFWTREYGFEKQKWVVGSIPRSVTSCSNWAHYLSFLSQSLLICKMKISSSWGC